MSTFAVSSGPRAVAQPARRTRAAMVSLRIGVMYALIMKLRIVGLALLLATSLHAEVLVLAGGRLIDGYGGPPLENAVIIIQGNTIRTVGTWGGVRIPDGARV